MSLAILFSQGMRFFFVAAGLYALVAMGVWLTSFAFAGEAPALPFSAPPSLWHAHEMLFGYAAAVLGGFFLTAVPSWTGTPSARAAMLAVLAALWLAGRAAIWLSGTLDPVLVAVVDLAFLPALAAKIGAQLVRRPKPQNVMFVGLITLLWAGNLAIHLDWTGAWPGAAAPGLRMGLLTVCAMIVVIGGRVIPAFTRNAMLRAGRKDRLPRSRARTEAAGVGTAILLPVTVGLSLPDVVLAGVALAAGVAQALRLAGWRGGWTAGRPILWSLHLAFAMLAAGYLALAAAWLGWASEIGALHLLGIGGIGGMTLAMMTRAGLGHTNRPLVAARPIALAYAMVAAAAALRFAGAEAGAGWYVWSVLVSGALWLAAFAAFTAVYLPILTAPRQESAA